MRSKKKKYVKFCPKCKSINIQVSNQGFKALELFGAPTIYRCLDCGYSSGIFPEIERDNLKSSKKKKC